jgi:hypothetical protein
MGRSRVRRTAAWVVAGGIAAVPVLEGCEALLDTGSLSERGLSDAGGADATTGGRSGSSSGSSSGSGSGSSSGSSGSGISSGPGSGSSSGSALDSGGLGTGCDAGQIGCSGACVSSSDIHHCGSCTADCTHLMNVSGTTSCMSSGCSFAASACVPGFADCNGQSGDGCETPVTTTTDCGRCGHACGGAACINGACQPQTLIQSIDTPTGMDVDGNGIYFIADSVVQSCALSGCTSGIAQLGTMFGGASGLVAANGSIAFFGTYSNMACVGAYLCPTTGCPSSNTAVVGGGYSKSGCITFSQLAADGNDIYIAQYVPYGIGPTVTQCAGVSGATCSSQFNQKGIAAPIAVDGSYLYFQMAEDGGYNVAKCPVGTSCAAPAAPTTVTTGIDATQMFTYGGLVYFVGSLYSGGLEAGHGDLFTCATAGCANPTSLYSGLHGQTQGLTADRDGVYFTSGSGVYTCPLSGCGGAGARPIASGQASPSIIRTDSQFVYWVNQGQPGDGSSAFAPGTASIMRVAK